MDPRQPILDTIEPDVLQRLHSRRSALRGGLTAAVAATSVPVMLGLLARESFAQAPTTVRGVLEFAYLLENLEAEFYKAVLGVSATAAQNTAFAPVRATLTAVEIATLDQIRKHEVAHVALLRTAITGLGGSPATFTGANFDFTGGQGSGTGPLAAATTSKAVLLAAAQSLEDTGVRAYKGQAANLIADNATLEIALRIHSVEARHAARIRRLRAAAGTMGVNFSGTVTLSQSGITGLSAAGQQLVERVYGGASPESNTTQAGRATTLSGFGAAAGASEAFDEPLTYDEVVAIVTPFRRA